MDPVVEEEEEEGPYEEAADREAEAVEVNSSSDSDADTENRPPPTHNKKLKKQRKRGSHSDDETIDLDTKSPFSESYLANQEAKRANLHPLNSDTMARTKTAKFRKETSGKTAPPPSPGTRQSSRINQRVTNKQRIPTRATRGNLKDDRACESDSDATVLEETFDKKEAEKKIQELERQLQQAKKDKSSSRGRPPIQNKLLKSVKKEELDAEELCVWKTTTDELFKVCKFISSENELCESTRCVMKIIDPKDHEGLDAIDLKAAQGDWIQDHAAIVLTAVNHQRNYVVEELYKLVKYYFNQGRWAELPTVEDMENLIQRKNLPAFFIEIQ